MDTNEGWRGLGPRRDYRGASPWVSLPPGMSARGSATRIKLLPSLRRCLGARTHFSTCLLLNISSNLTRGAQVLGGTSGPPNLCCLGPHPMRLLYTPIFVKRGSRYAGVGALGTVGFGSNYALSYRGWCVFTFHPENWSRESSSSQPICPAPSTFSACLGKCNLTFVHATTGRLPIQF